MQQKDKLNKTYCKLFGLFYHRPLARPIEYLSSSESEIDELQAIQYLITLADVYLVLPAILAPVYERVIEWLLNDTRGYKFTTPCLHDLLTIATKIQSKSLFNDTYVHIIGRYLNGDSNVLEGITDGVHVLMLKECLRIRELQLRVEHKDSPAMDGSNLFMISVSKSGATGCNIDNAGSFSSGSRQYRHLMVPFSVKVFASFHQFGPMLVSKNLEHTLRTVE